MEAKVKFLSARGIYGIIVAVALLVTACKKENNDPATTPPTTVINEVKLNNNIFRGDSSLATGKFDGVYNKDTKILTYTIAYAGVVPIAMHFHKGRVDTTGPVELAIGGPYASPINKSTTALTAVQETDLLGGKWYVNIHSTAYPNGEIRAQLFGNEIQFKNIPFKGDSSTATGTFNGSYDKTTKVLTYTIIYSGLEATAMHFHKGGKGENGPVEMTIGGSDTSPINKSTVALSVAQEADLLAGKWYANIHSNTHPMGEIRAQLIPGL